MRIALTFFFALFKSTSCWILLLFLSLSVYHFLEVVFHGTFINFNVREEKKKNPKLLWNATIFVVVFTQDSTIAHSMPLWNNAVEFNVGFSCVFFSPPSFFHQEYTLRVISVLSGFHNIFYSPSC